MRVDYLRAVWKHWKTIVTGGGIVAVLGCLKLYSTDPRFPWNSDLAPWAFGAVMATALYHAQYIAWRDERQLRGHFEGIVTERDPVKRALNDLSNDALELLDAIAHERDGCAWRLEVQSVVITVGARDFTANGDPRQGVRWDSALKELLRVEALELQGESRHQITELGCKIAEAHRSRAAG